MAVGRRVKAKSAKRRDEKSQTLSSGRSAKNLSTKGNDATIHQRKNTQRKYYEAKNRSNRDLKEKV